MLNCYTLFTLLYFIRNWVTKATIINKRTYVNSIDIYPHMPILQPHTTFHVRRISSVKFTSAHLYGNVYMRVSVARALVDSSDFGLLGEQSSPKFVIPCLGRRRTAVQNVTPLTLSSAEKSAVGHYRPIRTNIQTNRKWYIHTLPIGMCG